MKAMLIIKIFLCVVIIVFTALGIILISQLDVPGVTAGTIFMLAVLSIVKLLKKLIKKTDDYKSGIIPREELFKKF